MKLALVLLAAFILAAVLNAPTDADSGHRSNGDGWCCVPR